MSRVSVATDHQPSPLAFALDDWLSTQPQDWRHQLHDCFWQQGLPRYRSEAWRYTNVSGLLQCGQLCVESSPTLEHWPTACPKPEGPCLLFVNGRLQSSLSDPQVLSWVSDQVVIGDMSVGSRSSLVMLNQLMASVHYQLTLPATAELNQPLTLIHYITEAATASLLSSRVSIRVEAGAMVEIHEKILGDSGHSYVNAVTDIELAPAAYLRYIKQQQLQQDWYLSTSQVKLAARSALDYSACHLGASLVRDELQVELLGQAARVNLYGLAIAGHQRHVDMNTRVYHRVAETFSEQDYRHVLTDEAHGVFSGFVQVDPQAQKIVARQKNHNLLLSETAQVESQPALEIYADDVICSHGATVGQLQPDAIFYLRSRGLSLLEAKLCLLQGFIQDWLDQAMPINRHHELSNVVLSQLSALLTGEDNE